MQGVLLFEVSQWRSVLRLDSMNKPNDNQRVESDFVKEKILAQIRDKFPHIFGQSLADVVETCLRFDQITKGYSEIEVHREFTLKVVEVLKRLMTAKI